MGQTRALSSCSAGRNVRLTQSTRSDRVTGGDLECPKGGETGGHWMTRSGPEEVRWVEVGQRYHRDHPLLPGEVVLAQWE